MEAIMPNRYPTHDDILARLARAAQNGNRAKRRLAKKLATMSPDQLRRVSPDTFARLGPRGVALFAAASSDFKTIAVVPQAAPTRKKDTLSRRISRRWHFAHPLIKSVMVAALAGFSGIGCEVAFDFLAKQFDARTSGVIAGWPICPRLDFKANACVYRATSNHLDLLSIEKQTGIAQEILVAWNKHINFGLAVPVGALIAIPPIQTPSK
jgi:hypothetical protein